MLQITINVNAPSYAAQAIKEALAMYLEKYGDSRVVNITEIQAKDWGNEQQRLY